MQKRQFVVVCREDIPEGHPMRQDDTSIPQGPLVMEQYLGEPATLEAIVKRANALSKAGYTPEVWRVIQTTELRKLIVGALFLGAAVGVFAGLAILFGSSAL